MRDFWISCGHHLTDRDPTGRLVATDELLKTYLARPELLPPPEACPAERRLHAALLAEPRRPVIAGEIAAIEDIDAQENWRLMLGFRDHLLRHDTLEAAYLSLIRDVGRTPPLFIDQLVQIILRNALDGCEDAFVLRAAELFFRRQRLALHGGALIAADEERISGAGGPGTLSPLVAMLGIPAGADIEVLTEDTAESYWERSDRFDMALDLTAERRGVAAVARAIEAWLGHMLALPVAVEPLRELRDVPLTWYIGLDAEGTRIGDALWRGEALDESARNRVVALFRMSWEAGGGSAAAPHQDAYLIMAMTADKVLRMKPQNLLAGLPSLVSGR
jgi:Family of unknown function (DUF6352)